MQNMLGLYASIGVFAGVVQLAYLAVAFGVGGLLYARGRRSGEWTQWLLGLHLILSMGIGYLLTCIGTVSVEYGAGLPRIALFLILGIGYAASCSGLTTTLHFTRRVFRPGRGLPFAYATASGAALWMGWLALVVTGDVARGRFDGGWYWVMTGGMLACNVWVAFEPLSYYAQLRRRVLLGLSEPVVADRMLLWGIGSVARAVLVVVGPLSSRYLATLSEAERISHGAIVLMISSLLGLVTAGTYWLAFQPPRAYLRWVEQRAARRRAA
ncbi:MAG TPA: hypothetical protein VFY49_19235 [Myxococcota bacterium]|nr:hypothetical protein [Myxococcota bacterium]